MAISFPDQNVYPYDTVVFIKTYWTDGTASRGSGALIGRNDVLTAAHVVEDHAKTVDYIEITPAYDGTPGRFGTYSGYVEWKFFRFDLDFNYSKNTQAEAAWDLAIIGLAEPLGDRTGWLGWSSFAASGTYSVLGYPAAQGTALTKDAGFMRVLGSGSDAVLDLSGEYVKPGSSGGPIVNANNQVVGVVSTTGWANRLDGEADDIASYLVQNDELLASGADFTTLEFAVTRTVTGQSLTLSPTVYAGPVNYLAYQYIGDAPDEAVKGTAKADFINAAAGTDAVNGGAGDDVIDGGLGSNFLTGGIGRDVFFLDGRGGGVTWSTITDFSSEEELSLWGYRPGVSVLAWEASAGAAGFRGLTLHADLDANGVIDASVTWSGLTGGLPPMHEFADLLWFK